MNNELDARPGAMNRAGRLSARRVRRAPQAVSGGLLILATIMGVHLGLDAPAVSPVSPAAIAARYGVPAADVAADVAAVPPADADATQPDGRAVMSQGHQRGQRDGRGHE